MNGNENDLDLKNLFAAQPAVEPPSFDRLWTAATRQQEALRISARRRNYSLVFAALLGLLLTGYLYFRPAQPPALDYTSLRRMSKWRASTDFLLETPGSNMLRSTPDLVSTVSMKDFSVANEKTEVWKR